MLATLGCGGQRIADFGEQFDLRVNSRLGLLDAKLCIAPRYHVVHGYHHDEVNSGGNNDEVNKRGDKNAELDVNTIDGQERKAVEVGGALVKAAMSGMMMFATREFMTAPKAAPMTTATARSTTLPFIMKSLNPFSMSSKYPIKGRVTLTH